MPVVIPSWRLGAAAPGAGLPQQNHQALSCDSSQSYLLDAELLQEAAAQKRAMQKVARAVELGVLAKRMSWRDASVAPD